MSESTKKMMFPDKLSAGTKSVTLDSFLVWIFVLSFALDVKGQIGGSTIQYAMALINLVSFVLIFSHKRICLPRKGLLAFVSVIWLVFLIVGSVGAVLSNVPSGQYLRVAYQYFLMLEGLLVAWRAAKNIKTSTALVSAMTLAATISLIYTFFWEINFTGETPGNLRYTVLSPLIPLLLTVCGYDLIFARRKRLVSVFILGVTFAIIFLSLARGMLLPLLVPIGVLVFAWVANMHRGRLSIPNPMLRSVFVGGAVVICSIVIIAMLSPDIAEKWIERSTGVTRDSSFWTRFGAVAGQINQLSTHSVSWLAGMGFGHSYTYSTAYANRILPFTSPEIYGDHMWYPGEFMWITPIYYSGLFAGVLAVIALLWCAKRSYGLIARLLYERTWNITETRSLWIGALGYFAFLGMGFTQNPFMDRLSALFMGLTLGIVLSSKQLLEALPARSSFRLSY